MASISPLRDRRFPPFAAGAMLLVLALALLEASRRAGKPPMGFNAFLGYQLFNRNGVLSSLDLIGLSVGALSMLAFVITFIMSGERRRRSLFALGASVILGLTAAYLVLLRFAEDLVSAMF